VKGSVAVSRVKVSADGHGGGESVRDIARMAGISEKTARVLIRCGAAEQVGGSDPAGQDGESRNREHGASADAAPAGERVGTDSAVPAQPWS